jgi:hypothetical protein
MSFSYNLGSNPAIDYPRMLVGDTEDINHIFEDEEIQAFARIVASTWQSSMQYTFGGGATLPTSPISYLRVAAYMLKALAGAKARLLVSRLLDANITPAATARALRDQANDWMTTEDESGAFVVIEQCVDGWSFLQRFYRQVQRQTAQ